MPSFLLCNSFMLLQLKSHCRFVLRSSFSENPFVGLYLIKQSWTPRVCLHRGCFALLCQESSSLRWEQTGTRAEPLKMTIQEWLTQEIFKTKKEKLQHTPWCDKISLSQRWGCLKCEKRDSPHLKVYPRAMTIVHAVHAMLLYMPLQVSVSPCRVRNMNVPALHAYWSWIMFLSPFKIKEKKMESTGNFTDRCLNKPSGR